MENSTKCCPYDMILDMRLTQVGNLFDKGHITDLVRFF